jgi:1,2-diacylglycerol 3-beta-glucosyltransferase
LSLFDAISVLLSFAAVFFSLAAFRHFFYSTAAILIPTKIPTVDQPRTQFTILIPAHNEEAGIIATIESARALDYPPEMFKITAMADNCADKTAELARSAGIEVVERFDLDNPGKGKALNWFIKSRDWNDDEALVCLDADSVADSGYLLALDAHLQQGAPAAQGYNGCKEPDSPLAALSVLTNTMKNAGTYAGRAAFGLPAPLMNGWCLTGPVLREHGWESFSIAEDFEQTLRLAQSGIYARFVLESKVRSEKAGTFSAAATQRQRWSGGQSQVARTLGWATLASAVRTRSIGTFELAMDLMLPGYAMIAAGLITVALIAAAAFIIPALAFAIPGILLLALCALTGFFWAGPSWTLTRGLLLSPLFIAWKVRQAIIARLFRPKEWKRAQRKGE